ncbi:MAG: hypothetical protein ACP5OR_05630 [Candidatus Dormibacteria bacterium]
MHIILSRKGFDSASGGGPSPILPDGTLLSLPIPETVGSHVTVDYDKIQAPNGMSYGDIMRQLSIPVPSTQAHLDPDLDPASRPRKEGWRPILGQAGSAQGHLEQQGVTVGDLFLFFGLFRKTEWVDGKLRWVPGSRPEHVIWGYLEIGEMHRISSPDQVRYLLPYALHPHIEDWQRPKNTLYIASQHRKLNAHEPGAGRFKYDPRLVLTAPGKSASVWHLPKEFADIAENGGLSFHTDPRRWSKLRDGSMELQSVGRGQEFVMKATPKLLKWAGDRIRIGLGERERRGHDVDGLVA